jgi:hypothetical protein
MMHGSERARGHGPVRRQLIAGGNACAGGKKIRQARGIGLQQQIAHSASRQFGPVLPTCWGRFFAANCVLWNVTLVSFQVAWRIGFNRRKLKRNDSGIILEEERCGAPRKNCIP